MYFKVRIKCEECGCAFELEPFQFQERSTFACPNCGQKLNDDISAHLRAGLTAFSQIPNKLKDGGKFSFSVDMPGHDPLEEAARRLQEDSRLNGL